MRAGQVLCQFVLELWPFVIKSVLDFQLDIDLIGQVILTPDVDLEFVDGRVFANNGFYCSRVDISAANELHIIPAPSNTPIVKIPGAATGAGARGNLHHHIFGAIADGGNEAASKRGHYALA